MMALSPTSTVRAPLGAPFEVDLTVLAGSTPEPEVRIFVRTAAGQQRAERVLLWSIERVRAAGRRYAVHWLRAGSANARLEQRVPELCSGSGRALYCTVDQIYLCDPAQLLDLDTGACGRLSATDGSLQLIDCERLAQQRGGREAAAGLCGPIPRDWDVHPEHYSVGRSKRVRYAAPQFQPWRPAPERFVYRDHPNVDLWRQLEGSAIEAGFHVFSRSAPSRSFAARFAEAAGSQRGGVEPTLAELLDAAGGELAAHDVSIRESLAHLGSRDVAIFALDRIDDWRAYVDEPRENDPDLTTRWGASNVRVIEPLRCSASERSDAIVCTDVLEHVPDADLAWVLDELFDRATALVHVGIRPARRSRRGAPHSLEWWVAQLRSTSRRHPKLHWQVVFAAGERSEVRHGGRHLSDAPPTVWVLSDDRPGNTSQSTGLADALGWPYAIKRIRFSQAARLHNRLLGASAIGVARHRSSPLRAPWPDLVIAAGRRSAPVAQWIRRRNFGRTRLVHLGRKGGDAADDFDLVVTPTYGRLGPHPNRLEVAAPLHNVSPARIQLALGQCPRALTDTKRPRIVALVGGWSGQYRFDVDTARSLGRDLAELARDVGGAILATTSRRAGDRSVQAFCDALPADAQVYRWSDPDTRENPYLSFLGLADAFVVTGDSESMLSEAASIGRPVYIYPLPERTSFGWMRIGRDWVYARASALRVDGRSPRRLDTWCARMIDRGFVRPTRDLRSLHEGLIRKGVARSFGDPFDTRCDEALSQHESAVTRVSDLMGFEARR